MNLLSLLSIMIIEPYSVILMLRSLSSEARASASRILPARLLSFCHFPLPCIKTMFASIFLILIKIKNIEANMVFIHGKGKWQKDKRRAGKIRDADARASELKLLNIRITE